MSIQLYHRIINIFHPVEREAKMSKGEEPRHSAIGPNQPLPHTVYNEGIFVARPSLQHSESECDSLSIPVERHVPG